MSGDKITIEELGRIFGGDSMPWEALHIIQDPANTDPDAVRVRLRAIADRERAKSSRLLLSDAERERFAGWLEFEANTAKGMIEEMQRIAVAQAAIVRERQYIFACMLLADHLRRTESMSMGG